ncbi:MAG TPA: hypothetical protein VGM82_01015 [Gemmatimonadaceae bacterium]|jgi:hypothetical protein
MLTIPHPADRGVYFSAARKRGLPVVYAVDSNGEYFDEVVVSSYDPREAESAVEWLWSRLDALDPVVSRPALELVR